MGLAEDLTALYELHKSGGLSEAEFQEVKSRMIKNNPDEVAKIARQSGLTKATLTPLQVGAIAASASIGTRFILDHLKSDRVLQEQVEKLQERVGDLEEFHSADNQDDINSTHFDDNYNPSDFDF